MSLYTKYRPRDWDSVIGQDRIKTILQNALTHGRVGHAYLFHGSRGTGKTTSARILAKGVNCLNLRDGNPCHACVNCVAFDNESMLDVIEIDAASNTGVDNIRDLIEKARFEPNQGKYKVYIIDEVHMLSTGAFNALLKTLEEPPAHVKFILATTEVDKVPETIRSRALRFDFRKITEADIIGRLQYVISEEKIEAEEAAIKIIAKYARGGLRDALTLLEQNTIDSELSLEHVRMTLSLLEESQIDGVIAALAQYDTHAIMDTIAILRDMHVGARGFFEQIMYRLRDLMIENLDNSGYAVYLEIYELIESGYTRVRSIPDGMLLIEMTLLKVVKRDHQTKVIDEVKPQKQSKVESEKKELKIDDNSKLGVRGEEIKSPLPPLSVGLTEHILSPSEGQEQSGHGSRTTTPPGGQKRVEQDISSSHQIGQEPSNNQTVKASDSSFSYIRLLEALKTTKAAIVIDLKTARFEQHDTTLVLLFPKNWNYTRVNTHEVKNILSDTLTELCGGSWTIECRLDGAPNQAHIADEVF